MSKTALAATAVSFSLTLVLAGVIVNHRLLPLSSVRATGPSIVNLTQPASVGRYEKFEASFNITGTSASNFYLPFTTALPPGIATGQGITVTGIFTSPNGQIYNQPGFYFQEFQDQIKSNREWFYPEGNTAAGSFSWKVRFSPNSTGTWKYKIRVQDTGGTTESALVNFSVVASGKHGFVKPSAGDVRYFEFDDGTYFPGLGFNLNAGNIDFADPILGNTYEFDGMGANNIQLSRFWLSQKYMFGAAWSPWRSVNSLHQSQEPNPRISYPGDPNFKNAYPALTMPPAAAGSEVYWWLNADTTGGGNTFNYTPCLFTGGTSGFPSAPIPAKKNTNYRVRVRYRTLDISGPFEVLHWSSNAPSQSSCTSPGGTVIASSAAGVGWSNSPDAANTGWTIVSGTFNSGDRDYFNPFYLSAAKASKGHVFIDYAWLEEVLAGGQFGPNLLYKPWAAQHYYVNQRNAYAFDKALAYAEQKGLTFKPVILEKNDLLWRFFEYNGQLSSTPYSQNGDLFYGNGRESTGKTKTRFLHEAWWRYLQARWGYSTSIHSWELLNEGPSDPDGLHWIMVDELGKYMKCKVFDIAVSGKDCTYDHPNAHMVSTSFYGEGYPYFLWNNKDGNYPDIDFADQHMYARDEDQGFFDEAEFTYILSTLRGAKKADGTLNTQGAPKPFIRGETAWSGSADSLFQNNATDGLWLHNSIWGGINYGGMTEQYWLDGPGKCHIYKEPNRSGCGTAGEVWDHRNEFGNFNKFIQNVPLNKGGYIDAGPSVSNSNLRVWGQIHKAGNRAHIWIQNKNHTWKKVYDGVSIANQSGTITLSGFTPNKGLKVEWWNTYTGTVTSSTNMTTNGSGQLTLTVSALKDDTAVKIGDYSTVPITSTLTPTSMKTATPTPAGKPGDANGDGKVDGQDYLIWLFNYGKSVTGPANGDFNNSGKVDGADYLIWIANYEK